MQYWTSGRHRKLGVIFYGYNTSERVDEWGKPTKMLADELLAQMFREVRQHRAGLSHALTIGLMHHPLSADDPGDIIVNRGSVLKALSDHGADVVILSGHVHSDGYSLMDVDGIGVLELAASTMMKKENHRPPDSLRNFRIINENVRAAGLLDCRSNCADLSGIDLVHRSNSRLEGIQRGVLKDNLPCTITSCLLVVFRPKLVLVRLVVRSLLRRCLAGTSEALRWTFVPLPAAGTR